MNRRRYADSRRGISLAELLVVLSIATVLVGLSAKLIHRVMHAHSKGVAFQRGEQSALRLASQLRRDIHAANAADIGPQSDHGIMTLTDSSQRQIEYRLAGRSLVRSIAQGEKSVARESFDFPSDLVLHVEKLPEPERVVFVLESTSHAVPGPGQRPLRSMQRVPFAMRVEACLARAPQLAAMPSTKDGAP